MMSRALLTPLVIQSRSAWTIKHFCWFKKQASKLLYFWVYLLESSEQAKDLSYILRFFAKDSDNVFRGKVAAIDETFETIDEAGKCFTISHKTFMNQFVDENRKC